MHLVKILFVLVFALTSELCSAEEPDWSAYRLVLNHIRTGAKNGVTLSLIDYAAIKGDGSLEQAYWTLSVFATKHLTNREEKLAFYINAYNILALKMVADHWPTDSIKDAGSLFSPVWNKPAGQLDGRTVTLGELEHEVLRKIGEPRIHMAIVCASVSCPDLRAEPYTASGLDSQLDEQSRGFLANPGKGLRVSEHAIRVSKIFDWFAEDFTPYGGVARFVRRYRPALPTLDIDADLPYDWDVNG